MPIIYGTPVLLLAVSYKPQGPPSTAIFLPGHTTGKSVCNMNMRKNCSNKKAKSIPPYSFANETIGGPLSIKKSPG